MRSGYGERPLYNAACHSSGKQLRSLINSVSNYGLALFALSYRLSVHGQILWTSPDIMGHSVINTCNNASISNVLIKRTNKILVLFTGLRYGQV